MRRFTAWLLSVALLAAPAWAQPAAEAESGQSRSPATVPGHENTDPVFGQIGEILEELSRITGFEVRRVVPHKIISRDHLKEFFEERMKQEIRPEEIRTEELLLQKLGFVPADLDLKKTMVDLYTEQAAAFYDFRKKTLFLLETGDAALRHTALVHELAHALADQHFHLEKYLKRAGDNDDGALARLAVMEGQATWLMSEFTMQGTGRSLKDFPGTVDMMSRIISGGTGQYPVLDNVPLYIRESLTFPYASGVKFQQAVIQKLGRKGFTEVFRRPPETTQEILHPEKYLNRTTVKAPRLPQLRRGGVYRKVAEGILGEFDYAVLLQQYAGEKTARRIAPRWRAGAYRLLEHKKEKSTVLLQVSSWDSADTAEDFFRSYRQVLEGKWKKMEVTGESAAQVTGTGDEGNFLLLVTGRYVYCVEGMDAVDHVRSIRVR